MGNDKHLKNWTDAPPPCAPPPFLRFKTQTQARYRGFATRKMVDDKRRRRDEQMAYEKGNREREYRMKQREEQKAMLMDLPAGEVEDWQTQQEHVAATTVQANWKRHRAKKNFGAEREARSAAAAKIQRRYRQHNKQKPTSSSRTHSRRRGDDDGGDVDGDDVLMGSMDWGGGTAEEMFSVTRPVARQQKTIDQIVNSRKMDARREMEAAAAAGVPSSQQRTQQSSSSGGDDTSGGAGAGADAGGNNGARSSSGSGGGGVTMEAWSEGRQNTRRLLEEYREMAPKAAAAAARRKACRQAEAVYRAQRAMRHGSLAELPSDAKPNQFPSPVGVDEKVTRRLHAEALEAAQVESKWWKPLLALNREQKVLDQQEAERRGGEKGEGRNANNRYKSNRDRAGVHLTPTKSGVVGRGGSGAGGGFGIEAELLF